MASIEVADDCLAPERKTYLKYKGPDPWDIANKVAETIKPFFHVSSSGLNNTRVNWDISGDTIGFYSYWWVKKKFSNYTQMILIIKIQGNKKKADNTGDFVLELFPSLETKFEGAKWWIWPFYHLYNYLFYGNLRQKFLSQCRELTLTFRNEIKEHFNLKATPVPTTAAMG